MKNNIILMPRSGLGNRMRAISSFIYLKNEIDANLFVLWEPDLGLNAHYHEVFKENPNFRVIEDNERFKFLLVRRGALNHANPLIRNLSRFYNYLAKKTVNVDAFINDDDIQKGYPFVKDKIKRNRTVFVNTSSEIIDYPEGLRTFIPSDQVLRKMETTKKRFDDSTIGFHIRRTDHKIAIRNSPIKLFENKMKNYTESVKDIKFFIATDDKKVEEELSNKFQEKCIIHKKTYGRDSKEGIIDAAAEMFLLSNTQKIYGSYWSSFSIISAKLSGIDYEILKLKNN
jgi:hypothetical protein